MDQTPITPAQSGRAMVGVILAGDATIDHTGLQSNLTPRFRVEGEFTPDDIGAAAQALVDLLDTWTPDADHEDSGDDEPSGDDMGDQSYPEWSTLKPYQRKAEHMPIDRHSEDDELAGDETDGQFGEDEECAHFTTLQRGPGCIIADPDKAVDDDGCDDINDDREPEYGV